MVTGTLLKSNIYDNKLCSGDAVINRNADSISSINKIADREKMEIITVKTFEKWRK